VCILILLVWFMARPAGEKKPAAAAGEKKSASKKGPKVAKKSWRINFPLFEKRQHNYSIGNDVLPRDRDLTRFVKWPKYIRVARQKRILQNRLKIPPVLNQFRKTLGRNHALELFQLLHHYKPEGDRQRKKRLQRIAKLKAEGKPTGSLKRTRTLISGLNAVTRAVETGRAKLVVLANDVDPVELVMWLPHLLRKRDIPYVIVKGKARLGQLVGRKTAAVVALRVPNKEDRKKFANIVSIARERFNDNVELRRQWGGGKLGTKAQARIAKQKRILAKEEKLRAKNPLPSRV